MTSTYPESLLNDLSGVGRDVLVARLTEAVNYAKDALDNLSTTQARCTELLLEVRRLRGEVP